MDFSFKPYFKLGSQMNCLNALVFSAGVAFFVGSGGKTTLIGTLAHEARERGLRVILATTTHFFPFSGIETVSGNRLEDVDRTLERAGIACVAAPASGKAGAEGKLGPSPLSLDVLAAAADLVLVEADGSKRLPLKAHAEHEPVVPSCFDVSGASDRPAASNARDRHGVSGIPGTAGSAAAPSNQGDPGVSGVPTSAAAPGQGVPRTILLVGASGFDRPINAAAHRPELFCERTGAMPSDLATPELVARLIATEATRGIVCPNAIVVSQVRDEKDGERAGSFARSLSVQGIQLPIFSFDSRRAMHRLA